MRRRITRALVAAAAAGATAATLGFTAVGAASASTAMPAFTAGTPITTTETAGYEASGRDFRYIQALITVPNISPSTFFAAHYVQLANGSLNGTGLAPTGDQFTRAGIEACTVFRVSIGTWVAKCNGTPGANVFNFFNVNQSPCNGSLFIPVGHSLSCWAAFIASWNNSVAVGPYFIQRVALNVHAGDGVFFSIYFDQAGNELHYVITPPGLAPMGFKTQAFGPIFDHAAALTDFTNSTGGPISLPPFAEQFRITQFLQGALTTYSGARGSFAGPWTTSKVQATTNGLPYPQGHVILSPSYLFGDGMSANGAVRWGDAFGVWARV